jgi:SAM-dependent methyltransferase
VINNADNDERCFWQQRLRAVGHTGRFDRKIYVFDQLCRLRVFETWLDAKTLAPGSALDFGCGTGDFSRLLNRRGWRVIGYDKFITPKYRALSFKFIKSIINDCSLHNLNLILSVTTFDHILDDVEFIDVLKRLRNMLSPDGWFFFLEWSPAAEVKRSTYQAFRTMPVWMRALEEAGFCVTEVIPFFDPVNAPVAAWSSYDKMFITKIGIRFEKKKYLRYASRLLLRLAARGCLIAMPYQPPAASSINIFAGHIV